MHAFQAKHGNKLQSILMRKEMQVQEFIIALHYTLDLPEGQLVGFKDSSGKLCGPSGPPSG